jgi:FkbM family methyltransferase
MALRRIRRALWGIRQELAWAMSEVAVGRWGYAWNVLAYRIMALWPAMPGAASRCRLTTRGGATINYRRDRGDLQGIREIFIDEIYRLPDKAAPTSLVDLGANIGLATIWLCRTYSIEHVCAVEPVASNVDVLVSNLRDNSIVADVVRAAIGPSDGTTRISANAPSNMGQVGAVGDEVEVVAISRLLESLEFRPSLLKMDIEGAEADLLLGTSTAWLDDFDIVVTELHPQHVDISLVIGEFASRGFDYLEPVEVTVGTTRTKRERVFAKSALGMSR